MFKYIFMSYQREGEEGEALRQGLVGEKGEQVTCFGLDLNLSDETNVRTLRDSSGKGHDCSWTRPVIESTLLGSTNPRLTV